eukprot:Platyproteum_vivax@DN12161_c0_g1_i1.p1
MACLKSIFRMLHRCSAGNIRFAFVLLVCRFLYLQWKKHQDYLNWKQRNCTGAISACLYTIENLEELNRVEKRCLFEKNMGDIFMYPAAILDVIQAAGKCTKDELSDPALMKHIHPVDRWHVLNGVLNQLSSLVAPHHFFFDQRFRNARIHYSSSWYCFTIMCQRQGGVGRFFVTPSCALPTEYDRQNIKIRIVVVEEQVLRDIHMGVLIEPAKFFNSRHANRWQIIKRTAQLYGKQFADMGHHGSFHKGLHKRKPTRVRTLSSPVYSSTNKGYDSDSSSLPSHRHLNIDRRAPFQKNRKRAVQPVTRYTFRNRVLSYITKLYTRMPWVTSPIPTELQERNCISRIHVPLPTLRELVDSQEKSEMLDCNEVVVYRCGE